MCLDNGLCWGRLWSSQYLWAAAMTPGAPISGGQGVWARRLLDSNVLLLISNSSWIMDASAYLSTSSAGLS